MRSMLLPVLYLMGSEVPEADVYHAICTGYGGLLACLGGYVHKKDVLLTEHGIYTREKELDKTAAAGVDLDLCGHTHDGQIFPGNLIIHLFWENSCGYLRKGTMHNIVTSGAGIWGPNMRVGTNSEICPITVHFNN